MVIYGNLVITIYNIKINIEYFKKVLAQPPHRLFLSEKYVEFSKIIEICVLEKKINRLHIMPLVFQSGSSITPLVFQGRSSITPLVLQGVSSFTSFVLRK